MPERFGVVRAGDADYILYLSEGRFYLKERLRDCLQAFQFSYYLLGAVPVFPEIRFRYLLLKRRYLPRLPVDVKDNL
jgi:hypothetical protein